MKNVKSSWMYSVFILFILSRIWLAWITGHPVGVDSWDYLTWIRVSKESGFLEYAPLHVPGFYAFVSTITIYTDIDPFILYTYILPGSGAVLLYLTSKPLMGETSLFIGATYGFYVLRTSMIIPEWLGLILLPSLMMLLLEENDDVDFTDMDYWLSLVLISGIFLVHHLSGGIALMLYGYSAIRRKNSTKLWTTGILCLYAILVWSTAEAFPLKLIVIVITRYSLFMILTVLVVVLGLIKIDVERVEKLGMSFLRYVIPVMFLILVIIGLSIGADPYFLIYWSPALVLVILYFLGRSQTETTNMTLWVFPLILLQLFLAPFPIIRPLMSRIFVFQIQSFLPVAGIGLSWLLKKISESYQNLTLGMGIIVLLLLTSFQTYPNDDAWFQTEFRYFNDEVEMAHLLTTYGDPTGVDTDNRYGVMLRGVSLVDNTYGELDQSLMAQFLLDQIDYLEFNSSYHGILTPVYDDTGFMIGKFIHGQGGGAEDVAVGFIGSVLEAFQEQLVRVVVCGEVDYWTY